jgi:hypothetical protein
LGDKGWGLEIVFEILKLPAYHFEASLVHFPKEVKGEMINVRVDPGWRVLLKEGLYSSGVVR